jgi:hypothetical protein
MITRFALNFYSLLKILMARHDLTSNEIQLVAQTLIRSNALQFFQDHLTLIQEAWISINKIISADYNDTRGSIIAAFELINSLISNRDSAPLKIRFAYIQLSRAINAFKESKVLERRLRRVHRKVGYSDTSVAIDVYLDFKGLPLNIKRIRRRLTEHLRIGRRWCKLVGPSPLLLPVFITAAEKIMYIYLIV